jgi:hypothetical protein
MIGFWFAFFSVNVKITVSSENIWIIQQFFHLDKTGIQKEKRHFSMSLNRI